MWTSVSPCEEGDNVYRAMFDAPLHIVQLCPKSTTLALVCPSHEAEAYTRPLLTST